MILIKCEIARAQFTEVYLAVEEDDPRYAQELARGYVSDLLFGALERHCGAAAKATVKETDWSNPQIAEAEIELQSAEFATLTDGKQYEVYAIPPPTSAELRAMRERAGQTTLEWGE